MLCDIDIKMLAVKLKKIGFAGSKLHAIVGTAQHVLSLFWKVLVKWGRDLIRSGSIASTVRHVGIWYSFKTK